MALPTHICHFPQSLSHFHVGVSCKLQERTVETSSCTENAVQISIVEGWTSKPFFIFYISECINNKKSCTFMSHLFWGYTNHLFPQMSVMANLVLGWNKAAFNSPWLLLYLPSSCPSSAIRPQRPILDQVAVVHLHRRGKVQAEAIEQEHAEEVLTR